MEKRTFATRKFLWSSKRIFLFGMVLGLLMGFPGILVAQMKINVSTITSVQNGFLKLQTDFMDRFRGKSPGEDMQTQYSAEVIEFGGSATTVGSQLETNSNCDIVSAGLTIMKENLNRLGASVDPASGGVLMASEKFGFAHMTKQGFESFGAAGGSELLVTETLHSTNASTVGGNLVYLMQSEGAGQVKAGITGQYDRDCLECTIKEDDKGRGIEDPRLQVGLDSTKLMNDMVAGFQLVETHIQANGQYSTLFQGVIEAPKLGN